jgi:hypothetical protein
MTQKYSIDELERISSELISKQTKKLPDRSELLKQLTAHQKQISDNEDLIDTLKSQVSKYENILSENQKEIVTLNKDKVKLLALAESLMNELSRLKDQYS